MKNMDVITQSFSEMTGEDPIREMMAKYFRPVDYHFLCEYMEEVKSSGGVLLPLPQKSMGHPIIAVGTDVKNIKVGEWVVLSTPNVQVFEAFGKKWFFARSHDIYSVVDMGYLKAQEDLLLSKANNTKNKLLN